MTVMKSLFKGLLPPTGNLALLHSTWIKNRSDLKTKTGNDLFTIPYNENRFY